MQDIRADAIKEINAATAVKAGLQTLTDDEDTIRDTLEGETNLDGIIRALILSIDEDKVMVDGLTARIKELSERKTRFDTRIEAKRTLIAQAMEIAEWKSKELDIATVSLAKGRQGLRILEEADIPAAYWKAGKPTLDRTALLNDMKENVKVEGAELSNGAPVLTIRNR